MDALPWWGLPLIFALLEGALCSSVGTVLLTQRRILQANLIAHGVLPGLAIAIALQLDPAIGGWISGLAAALLAERLIRSHQQQQEAVQNTVLAGSLATGILLVALLQQAAGTAAAREARQRRKACQAAGCHVEWISCQRVSCW